MDTSKSLSHFWQWWIYDEARLNINNDFLVFPSVLYCVCAESYFNFLKDKLLRTKYIENFCFIIWFCIFSLFSECKVSRTFCENCLTIIYYLSYYLWISQMNIIVISNTSCIKCEIKQAMFPSDFSVYFLHEMKKDCQS